jgi:preprotein translocase subunit SecG
MGFLIGLLTVVLVFDCLLLILLVLIQLPKKEAGAALAFGGGTTDALFGAGSGTVLTKITKYSATGFFILAVIISVLVNKFRTTGTSTFEKTFANPTAPARPLMPSPSATPASPPSAQGVAPGMTSTSSIVLPTPEATNAPAAPVIPAPAGNGNTSTGANTAPTNTPK